MGGEFVHAIAEFEFGFAERLGHGLGGKESRDASGFLLEEGLELLEEFGGEEFLFGCQ
jgi:hypothetical protein